ncbi:MAG: thiamine pyrophosphate-dependent enzyme, partial [Candidatus Omnitrophota bacterium]
QMWAAQYYPFKKPRKFLTSAGLGTMGFGLPAAIGASLANPGKPVICISGDGSILMNLQELAVLSEEKADVKVLILNNGHLGLVRQQQELFYEKNYIATKFTCNPDFTRIAEGFGIESCDLSKASSPKDALKKALARKGPYLVNIPIDALESVVPMVIPGRGNHEMIGDG